MRRRYTKIGPALYEKWAGAIGKMRQRYMCPALPPGALAVTMGSGPEIVGVGRSGTACPASQERATPGPALLRLLARRS